MKAMRGARGTSPGPIGWIALGAFLLFTSVSVAGYATFGVHPGLLPDSDLARAIYAVSFRSFAQIQILLAFVAVAVTLFVTVGARWIPALFLVAGVAFLAEHVGTGYGFPFGGYRYTGLLGPRLGGRVPILVPLSWFIMAVPSFALASRYLSGGTARWLRISGGAALLVAWDLALDPAMSFLTPYWIWENPGAYYGMPWVNLLGWAVTSLAIMAVLEAIRASEWMREVPVRWYLALYVGVLLMPVGMVAAAGLWPAVVTTLAGVGLPAGLLLRSRRTVVPNPVEARIETGAPVAPRTAPERG